MAANAPWSVKGIDPKAREIAKDLARRSGMTLGEWLNQMIMEDGEPDDGSPAPPETFNPPRTPPAYRRMEAPEHPGDDVLRAADALDRLSARIEASEHRATLAISGIDQSVSGILGRLEAAEREQIAVAARFEGAVGEIAGEQSRLSDRLRHIEHEAAGSRSVEAVRSMEAALAKVASHLYDGEAQVEQRFTALKAEIDGLAARPAGDGAPIVAGVSEEVVERLAERISEAEDRTSAAMRGLEASFARLDERLGSAETQIEGRGHEAGLEQLAASLSARVDAVRLEMAEKIRAAADDRFERIERSLGEMTGHVAAAERRQAMAIERMGHEVLRMADTLGRRVQEVENRSADAIEQVGGDVARMANAMETRLARSDETGAQALEKLGGEIARITERLAERIANAERRSAQAMDDVGEQVSRVSDRLQDRQERTQTELAERIRLSEERTARLLEDARERIDERLEKAEKRIEAATAAPAPAYPVGPFTDPDVAPFGRESFDPPAAATPAAAFTAAPEPPQEADAFAPLDTDAEPFAAGRYEPELARFAEEARLDAEPDTDLELEPFIDEPQIEPVTRGFSSFDEEPTQPRAFLEDAEVFAPRAPEAAPRAFDPRDLDDPPAADAFDAPEPEHHAFDDHLHADELEPIHAEHDDGEHADAEPDAAPEDEEPQQPPAPLSTRELIEQARAAARAANLSPAEQRAEKTRKANGTGLFAGGKKADKKPKRKGSSPLATALFVSGGAAALSMALVGYELVLQRPGGALPERVADVLGLGAHTAPLTSERPAAGEGQPLAAVALNPQLANPVASPQTAAQNEAAAELYADGVRRVEAHDNTGVDSIKKAANLGYAPAEFYLGKLYESGAAGLKKDVVQARVWTERAAEAGDPKAMHNLGLDYFDGTGGQKDTTLAAEWFHRAADLGLVDSQYNLARLYEDGFGVARNPAEAYKWYLIAARSGDAESRAAAQRLKGQLSPEAQAAAERSAAGFQTQGPNTGQPAQAANTSAQELAIAQRALSRLGYYQGPYDGVSSPALSLAIGAYQRDQGLPSTGALDPIVLQKLAAAAQ